MKILRLNLAAFGPFTDTVLDLEGGTGGLHIIYGPNEAGKSSALRALRQMLFGIPARSSDDFIHPYGKLRVGGTLQRNREEVLEFIRRKGRVNTLRGADDETIIDETLLKSFLNGVDENLFTTMFGIDHAGLVQGGREIIRGGGDVGQTLFAAGSGISHFHRVQSDLRADAEALFKPSGQKPRINAGISEFRKNRKAMHDAQLPGTEWEHHDSALGEARLRRTEIETDLTQKERERNRLERTEEALPLIARRRALLSEYEAVANAVLLPENFADARRQAFEDLRVAESQEAQALEHLREIEQRMAGSVVPEQIIGNADTITALFQELGSIRKAAKDRLRLEGLRSNMRSDAGEILKDLRPDLDIEQAGMLRIEKQETVRIQELGAEHTRLTTRLENAQEEIRKRARQMERLSGQLAQLQPPPDTSALRQAAEWVQQHGDLEARYQGRLTEVRRAETAVSVALKKLPLWDGPLSALETLRVPSAETLDLFEDRLKNAGDAVTKRRAEAEEAARHLAETEVQIREISLAGEIPGEADLVAARKRRDEGWGVIRRMTETGDRAEDAASDFVAEFPPARRLSEAYEMSVRRADDLGDRLRREAERVARKAGLLARCEKEKAHQTYLINALGEAEAEQARARSEWAARWADTGITPRSPREMRVWASKQTALVEQLASFRENKAHTEEINAQILACRRDLSQALYDTGLPPSGDGERLNRLLAQARQAIEHAERCRVQREQALAERAQRQDELGEIRAKADQMVQELEAWRSRWETAVRPLGLDGNASPAQAGAVVEDLKALFDKLREAGVLEKRIHGMERDARNFGERVTSLIAREAPDMANLPPEQAVAELNDRLTRALKVSAEREELMRQFRQEEKALRNAKGSIAEIRARLDTMCAEARCDNFSDLPRAEERSRKRQQLEDALGQLEKQLIRLGAGATPEAFIREAEAVDPDTIGSRLSRLAEDITRMDARRTELDRTIGSEEKELERMDGSAKAAELAEAGQEILARLETDADQYIRLRLAAVVLNQAIERYREKHQGPILSRSSRLFARMTLGAFDALRLETRDNGDMVIAGIRPGGEIVHVEHMSEGTADQLYLAIRLASLEAWLEKNEPVPFVVDDILIKFDDDRAVATLQVLSRLSRQTQVIFFTHHRHLPALAEKHLEAGELFTHRLNT